MDATTKNILKAISQVGIDAAVGGAIGVVSGGFLRQLVTGYSAVGAARAGAVGSGVIRAAIELSSATKNYFYPSADPSTQEKTVERPPPVNPNDNITIKQKLWAFFQTHREEIKFAAVSQGIYASSGVVGKILLGELTKMSLAKTTASLALGSVPAAILIIAGGIYLSQRCEKLSDDIELMAGPLLQA